MLLNTSSTTDVDARVTFLVDLRTHREAGVVQMLTVAAGPVVAVVVAEGNLAPACTRGVWSGFAGGEPRASPNIAGFQVDGREAAMVHDAVCVAAGECPEELYAHGEKL